jgi:hypothetical protein
MNKQHNNIKINVMKSSMHNETKQIKAKNNVVPYLQCYKERNNSRMPRHYHEKLCTFGTKQDGVENNDIHPQV